MTDVDDAKVAVRSSAAAEGSLLGTPADPVGDAQRRWAELLVEQAQAQGVNLVGPGGLLADLTKRVLEVGLEVEMTEHFGYDKHDQDENAVSDRNRVGERPHLREARVRSPHGARGDLNERVFAQHRDDAAAKLAVVQIGSARPQRRTMLEPRERELGARCRCPPASK